MEVNYSGTVTAKAMGKNALIGDTSAAAAITLKKQVEGTLCEIKVTDASIRGRPFQDVLLKATNKPRKDLKVTATYDVSRPQFSVSPAYTLTRGGRSATVTGLYKYPSNQAFLEVASSLSKTEKINAVFTGSNRSVLADYSWASGVWTLSPTVYVAPPKGSEGRWLGTAALAVTRRLPSRPAGLTALKAVYDVGNETVALHVEGLPGWKAALKTPLGRSKGIAHPTLAFTVSRSILLDQPVHGAGGKPIAASPPAEAAPAAAPATPDKTPAQEAARPPTPGEQLVLKNAPLDDLFEQNMVKDERGVFTWSTNRK